MKFWSPYATVSFRSEVPLEVIRKRLELEFASRREGEHHPNPIRLGWDLNADLNADDNRISIGRSVGLPKKKRAVTGSLENDGSGTLITLKFSLGLFEEMFFILIFIVFMMIIKGFIHSISMLEFLILFLFAAAPFGLHYAQFQLRLRVLDTFYEIAEVDRSVNDSDIAVRKREE